MSLPRMEHLWAEALALLIRNPELRHQMGKRGRETVEQYRWDAVAQQVMDYYEDIKRSANGLPRQRAV